MGTYAYGFRKESRTLIVDGVKSKVQFLSYMYKPSFWNSDDRYFVLRDGQAQRSFESYDGGYIVVADTKEDDGTRTNLDGYNVYKGLKRAIWMDCSDHGMELVGTIKRVGKSYHLIKSK